MNNWFILCIDKTNDRMEEIEKDLTKSAAESLLLKYEKEFEDDSTIVFWKEKHVPVQNSSIDFIRMYK